MKRSGSGFSDSQVSELLSGMQQQTQEMRNLSAALLALAEAIASLVDQQVEQEYEQAPTVPVLGMNGKPIP